MHHYHDILPDGLVIVFLAVLAAWFFAAAAIPGQQDTPENRHTMVSCWNCGGLCSFGESCRQCNSFNDQPEDLERVVRL